jgi:hypothetical protein
MGNTKIKASQPLIVMFMIALGICLAAIIFGSNLCTNVPEFNAVEVCHADTTYQLIIAESQFVTDSVKAEMDPYVPLELNRTSHLFFHYHTKYLVWMFLFCLLIGTSFGFILPLLFELNSFSWLTNRRRMILGSLIRAIVLVFVSFYIAGGSWMNRFTEVDGGFYMSFASLMDELHVLLDNSIVVMMSLIILGGLGPIIAVAGVLFVNSALARLEPDMDRELLVKRFKKLSGSLNFFLFALAIMITGTTVVTAMGREAVVEAIPWAADLLLPIDFVYLYGLVFTVLLAVVYIPIYVQLKRKGLEIMEGPINPVETTKQQVKAFEESQLNILMMKSTSLDSLKVSLSILGPVLMSLLSKYLQI